MRRAAPARRATWAKAAPAAALVAVLVAAPGGAAGQPSYGRDDRVGYVARALDALAALDRRHRDELEGALYLGARRECRAGFGVATIGCLLELAQKTCAVRPPSERAACALAADLLLTNQLAEDELIDERTRFALMNAEGDFRAALRVALRDRHALLAAELALSAPAGAALPAEIDRFCAGRPGPLAWQRCVAALVWYIGTHPGSEGGT